MILLKKLIFKKKHEFLTKTESTYHLFEFFGLRLTTAALKACK